MSADPTVQRSVATNGDASLRQAISSVPRPARASALSAGLAFGWRCCSL